MGQDECHTGAFPLTTEMSDNLKITSYLGNFPLNIFLSWFAIGN